MGTGKTAVGKRLASALGMRFYDSDGEIEKVTGMTISQAHRKYGEIRIKSEENLVIERVSKNRNCVIAMGGSFLPDEDRMEYLKKDFFVISLTARPDVIFERVKRRNSRSAIKKGDGMDQIVQMMERRNQIYRNADFQMDTSEMDFQQIVERILSIFRGEKKDE
jgi:shikimate kinase